MQNIIVEPENITLREYQLEICSQMVEPHIEEFYILPFDSNSTNFTTFFNCVKNVTHLYMLPMNGNFNKEEYKNYKIITDEQIKKKILLYFFNLLPCIIKINLSTKLYKVYSVNNFST